MTMPAGLRGLPGILIPSGLVGAVGQERAVAEMLFEQRRCESLAYCRTMTAVYALHRVMYADDEAEYLARPGDFAEALEARRSLTAAGVALEAQVSTLLRLGSTAARIAIETAIGLVERLPKVFALIGENVISPKAGEAALHRSRALDGEQVRRFDELLADRLTMDYEVLSLPALREAADLIVDQIDAEAAERRRRASIEDRRVSFRPEQDGMAAVFALMPAEDVREVEARVGHIAGTVCDADPRTPAQRRADGWVQLTRGYSTLGCECETPDCRYREARFHGEPDADGVITRFVTMINVVINERDLAAPEGDSERRSALVTGAEAEHDPTSGPTSEPGPDVDTATESEAVPAGAVERDARGGFGYLVGHGPITGDHARELAAREDARIRPFGQRVDESASAEQLPPGPTERERTPGPASGFDGPRGTVDFAAVWADIVVRLEGHAGSGEGDGGWFGGGPPDDLPPDCPPPDGPPPTPRRDDDPDDDPGPRGAPPDIGVGVDVDARDAGGSGAVVSARGSRGYRPSADLRRYLRLVFPRCVFPHCTRPATRAQVDHRREYDHRDPELGGATSADQLQPLCVAHHQLKSAGGWIDARLPDGRILWTSPYGRRYIVDPSGTVLALFPDLKRVRWTLPDSAEESNRRTQAPPPGGRTRLQREHARRERLRQRNVAAMEAELARANTPISTIEEHLAAAVGAPKSPSPTPSFDGPPPF
ncbi:HNH endonuclease signature motif containing protein [Tsukamurella tyrosinosolvens]|uniref:HNH endonuclease signature motif containing protein n=1 Tax=Tsukamurella tyrosinosolvens TaxID=57704 RepID=UPI000C7F2C7C|nr:HNH endonuclease signature motif containing protein [Tsukamurella tyrosinosolvens]